MTDAFIPFNRPYTTGRELDHIADAVARGHLSGNGEYSARATGWLERNVGVARALLTHSCTGALEMAAVLAELQPGDEVVMPSFTFVSTANAVVLRGAVPVFVDVRADTLNLDETKLEAAIGPRTRGVMVMHYAGVGCEMDAICDLARRHDLVVIEDAAQAILATYRGRPLGSFGDFAAFSFHETKNIQCGEGGALLVKDGRAVERAEIIHEKGTNRRAFFRGQVDKYTWVDIGSSYLLSDVAAAFLWAQLERADEIVDARREIWQRYHDAFADLEAEGMLRRPVVPDGCGDNGHLYYLLLPSEQERDRVLRDVNARGVNAVFHYLPLHTSPFGRQHGRAVGDLGVTERSSARLLRLPLWAGMSGRDVDRVIDAVRAAVLQAGERMQV
jgi:dTDP-4-amino-4,6-dideoxygalactose transaminase